MIPEERKGCRYIRSQHRKCNTESLFVSCIMRKEALLPASPVFSKHRGPRRFHNFVLAYPTLSRSFPAFLLFLSPLSLSLSNLQSPVDQKKRSRRRRRKRRGLESPRSIVIQRLLIINLQRGRRKRKRDSRCLLSSIERM